jgi:hypothetical protein
MSPPQPANQGSATTANPRQPSQSKHTCLSRVAGRHLADRFLVLHHIAQQRTKNLAALAEARLGPIGLRLAGLLTRLLDIRRCPCPDLSEFLASRRVKTEDLVVAGTLK